VDKVEKPDAYADGGGNRKNLVMRLGKKLTFPINSTQTKMKIQCNYQGLLGTAKYCNFTSMNA